MAKDNKKKRHPIRTFLSVLLIFISCFLIFITIEDLLETMRLKKEVSSSEMMIVNLENQKNNITVNKDDLENPDYVQRFARGKYLVSKPGDEVFKLPPKSSDSGE